MWVKVLEVRQIGINAQQQTAISADEIDLQAHYQDKAFMGPTGFNI